MKKKILIVDDDQELLTGLKKSLSLRGYSVTACDKAQEGIAKAREEKYDLLLVDIRLPQMSGVEVIKTVEKIDDNVRFLIITGYSITGEIADLIETCKRVHGYIFKPFNLESLQKKIEEILRLS